MAEAAFVQELRVFPCASQPGSDRGVSKAEDPRGRRRVQPFGQRSQYHGDVIGRGFQPVQGRVSSRTEGGAARLTPERLNPLGLAMLAISDEGMEGSVGVAEVRALTVGASEPFGVYAFGGSPSAFHLAPGSHRHWGRHSSRRCRGGESTGWAIVGSAGPQQMVEPAALGPSS